MCSFVQFFFFIIPMLPCIWPFSYIQYCLIKFTIVSNTGRPWMTMDDRPTLDHMEDRKCVCEQKFWQNSNQMHTRISFSIHSTCYCVNETLSLKDNSEKERLVCEIMLLQIQK